MNKFLLEKNKYFIILSGKDISRHIIANNNKIETLYDIYWAFAFGNAKKAQILSYKNKKVFKTFNSLQEWRDYWKESYGSNANYFILHDRY